MICSRLLARDTDEIVIVAGYVVNGWHVTWNTGQPIVRRSNAKKEYDVTGDRWTTENSKKMDKLWCDGPYQQYENHSLTFLIHNALAS